MNLNELLKKYRLQAGLSQNEAAEAFGVDVHTIQNWEHGRLPSTSQLTTIKNVYNIPYDLLMHSYFESICPKEDQASNTDVSNLPGALFVTPDLKTTLCNLTFTEFETTLLKYLAIYCPDWMNMYNESDIYKTLPYEYVKNIDIIDFANMIVTLQQNRFHNDESIAKSVTDYITGAHWTHLYNKDPVQEFNINTIPMEYVIEIIFSIYGNIGWPSFAQIKEIAKGHTTVFEKDINIRDFLCQSRPQRFSCQDYFKNDWYSLISLTDCKMYHDVPKEYCGAHLDFAGWTYDVFINNFEPKNPASEWIEYQYTKDEDGIITACHASLTEKGQELWKYALQHPEYFELSDEN